MYSLCRDYNMITKKTYFSWKIFSNFTQPLIINEFSIKDP